MREHCAAAKLAHNHDIGAANDFGLESGTRKQRLVRAGVTQAGEHLQLVTQLHQPVLFLGPAVNDDMIPLRTAGRTDQQRIRVPRLVQRFGANEAAVFFEACTVQQIFAEVDAETNRPGRNLEYL